MAEEPRAPEALSSTFMLNMTSDASVRRIVRRIGTLAKRRVQQLPDMETFSPEFDPELSEPPFLPFSAYVITGTAGAGKSTSVSLPPPHDGLPGHGSHNRGRTEPLPDTPSLLPNRL